MMARNKKIILGLFSILPIVSFLVTFEIIVAILFSLGIMLDLMSHVAINPRLNKGDRIKWVILLFFLGMFVFPVYWYLHIWKENPTASNSQSGD